MTAARDEVLARVRRALADVPAGESPEDVPVPRDYRRREATSARELVEQLADRLRDYGAGVQSVAGPDVAAAVGRACAARGSRRGGRPPPPPPGPAPPRPRRRGRRGPSGPPAP